MSPRFSPPRSNSGLAYSRHRPNQRVEILWRSLLRMHFLAEGSAALPATQGKTVLRPHDRNKRNAKSKQVRCFAPALGWPERRGKEARVRPRPLPGLSLFGQPSRINLSEPDPDKTLHLLRNQRLEKQGLEGTSTGNHLRQFLHCFREHARVHVDVRLRRFRTHQRHVVKRRQ